MQSSTIAPNISQFCGILNNSSGQQRGLMTISGAAASPAPGYRCKCILRILLAGKGCKLHIETPGIQECLPCS